MSDVSTDFSVESVKNGIQNWDTICSEYTKAHKKALHQRTYDRILIIWNDLEVYCQKVYGCRYGV